MNRWIKSRNNQMVLAIGVLFCILIVRLFMLTIAQGEVWTNRADNLTSKSIYTIAPRGQIFDRNGQLIAGNTPSFNVRFSADGLDEKTINDESLALMKIFEKNGDTYVDNLPIQMDGLGNFHYTYQKNIETWLESESMPLTFTAKQAFDELRARYEVAEGLDKYEAQSELQNLHGIYPPISVKNMTFTENIEKESFLGRYKLDYKKTKIAYTAEEAFQAIRKKMKIEESLSDSDARKIMIIRNEMDALGYLGYIPAKIAGNVSEATIVMIEEKNDEFKGVEVTAESVRSYPNGRAGSHVVGYLGKISESEKKDYAEKGYSPGDLIGKDGIESAFEDKLKGKDGIETVQVNSSGQKTATIGKTEPKKGEDIYLTLDLDLQKTAEDSLERVLSALQTGGTFQSKWGNYNYGKAYPNANVGAVVAIEVETGEVLAMASYPDFDPNLFATGISSADWKALQKANPRDPLSPAPLYNVAARTAVQPGSTFKPVTATAALDSGLDSTRKIRDAGYIQVGNSTFGCLVWNRYKGNHGLLNLYEALEVSCNYYFYDLASNYDYAAKKSLGLSSDMGIDKIMKFAKGYGLGLPTGIEIKETVLSVPTEEKKITSYQNMLKVQLRNRKDTYFKPEVAKDKELLDKNLNIITSWMDENPSRNETIRRLADVGIKEDMIETVADICKYTYFNQAKFTISDELNIAIGQGENSYTPLQMANYIATLGNQGLKNQVSIVKGIEGEGAYKKAAPEQMEVSNPDTFDDILEGMRRVANGSRGSARPYFANFPIEVAAKTGTAERGGKINPMDEVAYVKQNLYRIAPQLTWAQVEAKMSSLMQEDPEIFSSKDVAVGSAVVRLTDYKVTKAIIDQYKPSYENFSWFVCTAPVNDPKIAVAVLIFQGGTGGYGAPVARDIIGQYLELDKTYEDYNVSSTLTQ